MTGGAYRFADLGPARDVRVAVLSHDIAFAASLSQSLDARGFDVRAPSSPPTGTDVVVLDVDPNSERDGVAQVSAVRRAGPEVLALNASPDPVRLGACLVGGAAAVLPRSAGNDHIALTLRHLAAGRPGMPPQQRAELVRTWYQHNRTQDPVQARLGRLTAREREVLGELIEGHRVRDIAVRLGLTEATVRTHVKSILAKLGVRSQIAAVALAVNADWDGAQTRASRRPHMD